MSRQRKAVPSMPRYSADAASSISVAVWDARTAAMNSPISSSLELFDKRITSVIEPFAIRTIPRFRGTGLKKKGERHDRRSSELAAGIRLHRFHRRRRSRARSPDLVDLQDG